MNRTRINFINIFVILCFLLAFSGCTIIFQKGRRSDIEKIGELSQQIDALSRSKADLEEMLKKEIADKEVSLSMQKRGLVLTFVSEVLFDSGKADLKTGAYSALDKVADVLLHSASGLEVGIEGHTDNQPIKYSGWKSNWDLSGARAKSVLEYLLKNGVEPERLSFIGYGEYRPITSNNTKEGRQRNRRVEIVIFPPITKERQSSEPAQPVNLVEPQENLK